jgi:hypothetical protein
MTDHTRIVTSTAAAAPACSRTRVVTGPWNAGLGFCDALARRPMR